MEPSSQDPASSSSTEDLVELLENRIESSIAGFKSSRTFYRRGSLIQTVLAATLGAITTFLIAVNQIYNLRWLTVVSLLAAGLTTISAAWGSWFGFHNLWLSNQATLNSLYALRVEILFEKLAHGRNVDVVKARTYFDEYQRILDDANARWLRVRESRD
jgi:hypothetical protein